MVCANLAHTTMYGVIEANELVTNCNQLKLLCNVPKNIFKNSNSSLEKYQINEKILPNLSLKVKKLAKK